MNAKIKRKWLKALRSGKHKQGKYQLRLLNDTRCCLGVLCDIVDPKLWNFCGRWEHNEMVSGPSAPIMDKTGLSRNDVFVLVGLNDNRGWSFKKIANWIEKHL